MKRKPYLWAALSGLLLFFIFPNSLHLHLWPLAWAALVPLLLGLNEAQTTRQAAKIAGLTGLAGYPLFYHWLVYTMHTYADMPYPVCFFVLIALVLVLSLFLLAFGAAYHLLTRRLPLSPLLAAPLAWVALEYLRGHFPFGGFPWALLAYSQFKFLPLIQITEFTGPYGVSFLIVLTNAALARFLDRQFPPPLRVGDEKKGEESSLPPGRESSGSRLKEVLAPLAWGGGLPLLAVIYGLFRLPLVDSAFAPQPQIVVGVVQPNIDQGLKWDEEFFWESMNQHLNFTHELMKLNPRLVIWPEAAVTAPGGFSDHWRYRSPVIDFLAQIETYLLTGALRVEDCEEPAPGRKRCAFNSVYLLTPRAENVAGHYDKVHLVPFGEYVPLTRLFFFADAIARGNTGATTPGAGIKVLSLPEAPFGCVICYEVIFPELVRRFIKEGAQFMTTITNDAWFGKTGAPYQHHANVVFRAVENRVYFVRSANTGISSIIDPAGRILHATDIYVPASFAGTIRPSPLKTFYSQWGDVFAFLLFLSFVGGLAAALFSSRFLAHIRRER